MQTAEVSRLLQLLRTTRTTRSDVFQLSENASEQIINWIKEWKRELQSSYEHDVAGAENIWRKHRDFNDELVVNGFYEFAYKLMQIENPVLPCGT